MIGVAATGTAGRQGFHEDDEGGAAVDVLVTSAAGTAELPDGAWKEATGALRAVEVTLPMMLTLSVGGRDGDSGGGSMP